MSLRSGVCLAALALALAVARARGGIIDSEPATAADAARLSKVRFEPMKQLAAAMKIHGSERALYEFEVQEAKDEGLPPPSWRPEPEGGEKRKKRRGGKRKKEAPREQGPDAWDWTEAGAEAPKAAGANGGGPPEWTETTGFQRRFLNRKGSRK